MKTRKIVLFLGPPGSGKGSLSQLCVRRLGWKQLSTGNLCREYSVQDSELGRSIAIALKSGTLISDDLMVSMVSDWLDKLEDATDTIIFDGFPRTVPQAESLQNLIVQKRAVSLELIRLSIPDQALIDRLLTRAICQDKQCQSVYSLRQGSGQVPTEPDRCDECRSPLERRSDDEKSAILHRLDVYHGHERGLLEYYATAGHRVRTLEVAQPLEEVYTHFIETAGIKQL